MSEKVLPIPCTKVEGETVKDWFQKINEELDELKELILEVEGGLYVRLTKQEWQVNDYGIPEEAADTITVITSMLEAMGIDEDMRQEAQKRVNEKNKGRGRF